MSTKDEIIAGLKIIMSTSCASESQLAICTNEPPAKKSRSIYNFHEPDSGCENSPLDKEFSDYLLGNRSQENECPLIYWNRKTSTFPNLSKLARRYLSFPASSGPVERIFSSAGKIFRADRCKLSDRVFSQLSFIKCNKKYNTEK